jgi:hypothetical protein
MTQQEARAKLAGTWAFTQVGGAIVLRELSLIDAVQAYRTLTPRLSLEAACSTETTRGFVRCEDLLAPLRPVASQAAGHR